MTTTKTANEPSAKVSEDALSAAIECAAREAAVHYSHQKFITIDGALQYQRDNWERHIPEVTPLVKAALTAALPHLTVCVGEVWRTIESAPKDGTWILAFRQTASFGSWDTIIPVAWYELERSYVWPDKSHSNDPYRAVVLTGREKWIEAGDYFIGNDSFTHWMPLPAPPTPEANRG